MNADGGEFMRGELRSITSILKQSETPLDKFHEQMKLMDRAFKEGAISAEQFAQSEEFLAKKFGVLTYKMEEQLQAEKKLADQAIRTAEANRALAENAARLATITNASLSPVQRSIQSGQHRRSGLQRSYRHAGQKTRRSGNLRRAGGSSRGKASQGQSREPSSNATRSNGIRDTGPVSRLGQRRHKDPGR
jgi:hypothetical protein